MVSIQRITRGLPECSGVPAATYPGIPRGRSVTKLGGTRRQDGEQVSTICAQADITCTESCHRTQASVSTVITVACWTTTKSALVGKFVGSCPHLHNDATPQARSAHQRTRRVVPRPRSK